MREIKFRKWIGGSMDYSEDTCMSVFWNYYQNTDTPIMQFTGLKDKNGMEIYEGDIVKLDEGFHTHQVKPLTIRYSNGAFIGDCSGAFWFLGQIAKHCEIIGNIHEHGSLLNDSRQNPALDK